MIGWLVSLFKTRWPEGTPLSAEGVRYGTRLQDGTIVFAPGMAAFPLSQEEFVQADPREGDTQHIEQDAQHAR
jgi:hypothetical protein